MIIMILVIGMLPYDVIMAKMTHLKWREECEQQWLKILLFSNVDKTITKANTKIRVK